MNYEAWAIGIYRIVKVSRWTGKVTVEVCIPGQTPELREFEVGDVLRNRVTLRISNLPDGLQIDLENISGTGYRYYA